LAGGYLKDEAPTFGPWLVWTRTREAAMRLAECRDPIPQAVAVSWTDVGDVPVRN